MHSPRPYGLSVIGGELTDNDEAFIANLAKKLTNLKEASQLESLKFTRALPDGGYVIIVDAGGIFRAIAHKTEQEQRQQKTNGLATDYIPMLYSGVCIGTGLSNQTRGIPFKFTRTTRRRLVGYVPNQLAPESAELQRFRVELPAKFLELSVKNKPPQLLVTPYYKLRPTWYSGAMAEVMQITGGYGRQVLGELPQDNPLEIARMIVPEPYRSMIREEINDVRLPAYTGLPNAQGQVLYDYKFATTNAVGFDDLNKPWLLEVNIAGVFAMPLPLIPATTTTGFKLWVEQTGDDELKAILDRFGGMPSGESFPTGNDFGAWFRAGVVIKVCDVADFYDNMPHASTCGWSFNLKGNEAINTCHKFNAQGLCVGSTYKLRLQLKHAENQGLALRDASTIAIDDANKIGAYIAKLYEVMQQKELTQPFPSLVGTHNSIKYKLRKTVLTEILARADVVAVTGLDYSEVDYWNNLTLQPIAQHTGNIAKVNTGFLYGGSFIKFPEPFFDGLVSANFAPKPDFVGNRPKTDTIVFAYYIDDQLKVVKLFQDERNFNAIKESTFEDIMIVGEWTETTTSGQAFIDGEFYTSDFDDRKEIAPTVKTTTIKGRDLGYTSGAAWRFDFFFWRTGTLFRTRYYSTKTTIEQTQGESVDAAIVVPMFCRNTIIYGMRNSITNKYFSEEQQLRWFTDPNQYRIWTDDKENPFIFGKPEKESFPRPTGGTPVYAEIYNHTGDPGDGGFSDQGDWLGPMPQIVTNRMFNYQPSAFGNSLGTVTDYHQNIAGFKGVPPKPFVNEYKIERESGAESSGYAATSLLEKAITISTKEPDDQFFRFSPDTFMNFYYLEGCRVVFGSADYGNISYKTESGQRFRQGYTVLADHSRAHHFIGVING